MRFFNDYVKSHDYLNHSSHLARRFRFQRTLFTYRIHMTRKRFFRCLFMQQAYALRYRVVEFQALNLWHMMPSFSSDFQFNFFLPVSQTWRVQLALAARNLPVETLAAPRQRFLLGLNFLQINLWSNALLADDPLAFGGLVRMD